MSIKVINSVKILPIETWGLILDRCSKINSLISLAKVNTQIYNFVLRKLQCIQINRNFLCEVFYHFRDLYTYEGRVSVFAMKEFVLLKINIEGDLICNAIFNTTMHDIVLENNQMLIYPTFGVKSDFRLNSEEQRGAVHIRCTGNVSNPHLLIAIMLAVGRVNRQYYELQTTIPYFFT